MPEERKRRCGPIPCIRNLCVDSLHGTTIHFSHSGKWHYMYVFRPAAVRVTGLSQYLSRRLHSCQGTNGCAVMHVGGTARYVAMPAPLPMAAAYTRGPLSLLQPSLLSCAFAFVTSAARSTIIMPVHTLDPIDESHMSDEDIYLQRKLLEWQASRQHDAADLKRVDGDNEEKRAVKGDISPLLDRLDFTSRSPSYPPLPDTPEEPSLKDYRLQLQHLDEANKLRLRAAREQRDRENEAERLHESRRPGVGQTVKQGSPGDRIEMVGPMTSSQSRSMSVGAAQQGRQRPHASALVAVAVVVLLACFPVLFLWSFR